MLPISIGKRKSELPNLTSLSPRYYTEIGKRDKLNVESALDMKTTAQKLVSEAMELPPQVRAFVAEKLIESLDVESAPRLSAKWKREVRRRCAEVDRGVKLSDAEAVFARALKSLG
jgi:hypothetical protein